MVLSTCRILVAGDLLVDHYLYQDKGPKPLVDSRLGSRHVISLGGANGIVTLLETLDKKDQALFQAKKEAGKTPKEKPNPLAVRLGVKPPQVDGPITEQHAFTLWRPFPRTRDKNEKRKVWRAERKMDYAHTLIFPSIPDRSRQDVRYEYQPPPDGQQPDLLVLDDSSGAFRTRHHEACWHLSSLPAESWILLKLAEPVLKGDLWRTLAPDNAPDDPGYAGRLVCLVAARDLRAEPVSISAGSSWESTLENLAKALDQAPLRPLMRCRHLIVTFENDGVLWIDNGERKQARLCYDASRAEGDFAGRFEGEVVGYHNTMTAALAYWMARGLERRKSKKDKEGHDKEDKGNKDNLNLSLYLSRGIEAGLIGMRDLLELGHGEPGAKDDVLCHQERSAEVMLTSNNGKTITSITFAWPPSDWGQRSERSLWSLAAASQHPFRSAKLTCLAGLAATVTRLGDAAYRHLPQARFDDFVTAERAEIEALRIVSGRMANYRNTAKAGDKPLGIGVFGPPGAGKSFAVRRIAAEMFGKEAWLEFNLSQFRDENDLKGAFHQVRDLALGGLIPVAFWDEFDSQDYKWLRLLLAPMQDGRFQGGDLSHAISRCVFVFAGGTCDDYDQFRRLGSVVGDARWKQLKGPDFGSRLDAIHNVLGPNRRKAAEVTSPCVARRRVPAKEDADDIGYTLRRALLLRGALRLDGDEILRIDPALLRAMLLVPRYHNGSRSMEKLLRAMNWDRSRALRLSDLPPRDLLNMYVDADAFLGLVEHDHERDFSFTDWERIETIAEAIHTFYQQSALDSRWEINRAFQPPYAQLHEEGKEDNRAAARRMPTILAMVGLDLEAADSISPSPGLNDEELKQILDKDIERLAEAEHNGWLETHKRSGWTWGPRRDEDKRTHHLMVSYAKLPEDAQNRDRALIRAYPDHVKKVGHRIIRHVAGAFSRPPSFSISSGEPATSTAYTAVGSPDPAGGGE